MNVKDVIRMNMRALSRECGGVTALSRQLGKSQSQISQLIGTSPTKNIGDRIASQMEKLFEKPSGWLDCVHTHIAETQGEYQVSRIYGERNLAPLLSWQQAKSYLENPTQPISAQLRLLTIPEDINGKSFALEVQNDSMTSSQGTSFPMGSIIIVDPEAKSYSGAFVLTQSADEQGELNFRQLHCEGNRNYLLPLNPRYPTTDIPDLNLLRGVIQLMIVEF